MTTNEPTPVPAAPEAAAGQPDAPTPEELQKLAWKIAVLGVHADDESSRAQVARAAYTAVRQYAADRFALARKLGVPQVAVMLPGGVEAGKLSLKAGGKTIDTNEDLLVSLVAAGMPGELEDYAVPQAELDPRTVALLAEYAPDLVETRVREGALWDDRAVKILAEHAPDLVNMRIRPGYREELAEEIDRREGFVADPASGELVKVATVTHHDPTGEFSYTGKTAAAAKVRAALEAGLLRVTDSGEVIETTPDAA